MPDTVTIRYFNLIVGVIATAVLVCIYLYFSTEKKAEVAVAIGAGGISLTALIYSALNVHLFYETQTQTLEVQRQTLAAQGDAIKAQREALERQDEANATQTAMLELQRRALDLQQEGTGRADEEKKVARKLRAMQFVMSWNEPEMAKLTVVAKALGKSIKDLDPKEVAAFLQRDENKDNQHSILLVLNFLENMALAIKHQLADDAFLQEYFQDIVRLYYYSLQTFIQAEIKAYQSENLFVEFRNLVKRWGQMPPSG